jgi:glycosyltransferase involved in cell wall biosynthesis
MARICVVREWYYPVDTRVRREIDALIRAGHEVDLVCAAWPGQPHRERDGQLNIYRLPIARRRGGLLRYFYEFVSFQILATLFVAWLMLRRHYDVVQVNSLPDWLVFAAVVPRLLGARVLLDLHECMPEYAMTKYKLPPRHPVVRLLMFLEQRSIRFASSVITCTEQMRERFIERGAPAGKVAVILNSFDEDRFDPRRYPAQKVDADHFVVICHGTIDENYGLDLVVRAVALLKGGIPALRLRIYGDGTHRGAIAALVKDLGLEERVWLSPGFIPVEELLPRIAEADAGVVAIRRDAFRDLTHCNKMYDLVTMRKPVIISRTRAVEAYFGEDCFRLFESGDAHDLARAIYDLYADPELRDRLVHRATTVGEPYRWTHQQARYVEIVHQLANPPGRSLQHAVVAEGSER